MASNAALAGLASAADFVSSYLLNQQKSQLEEKLLNQRLEAQNKYEEQRAQRAEAREAKRVAKESIVQDANGNFVKRSVNAYGDTLSETPASQYEIDTINNARTKDQLSLENAAMEGKYKQAQIDNVAADNARADRSLAIQEQTARSNRARDAASIRESNARIAKLDREDAGASAITETQAANSLVKGNEDLVKSLTSAQVDPETGRKSGDPLMTREQVDLYARAAIANAAKSRLQGQKVNADDLFVQGLRNAAYRNRQSTARPASTSGGFSLDSN